MGRRRKRRGGGGKGGMASYLDGLASILAQGAGERRGGLNSENGVEKEDVV